MARTAKDALRQLAGQAAEQPAPPGTGRFEYIRTTSRSRRSAHLLGEDGALTLLDSRLEPTEREFWIAADGSGRIEQTHAGRRTGTSRAYGPGELHFQDALPTEPAELEQLLAQRQHGWGTFEWFKAFRGIWGSRVAVPRLQSALLTVLSGKPDLELVDVTTDATGRSGVAVSTDTDHWGRPQRRLLIFDPETGMLNADETLELASAEDSSYTVWLATGYVHSTDTRP